MGRQVRRLKIPVFWGRMLNFRAAYASRTNLNVEAASRSETLVLLYKYTRHKIPDDGCDRQHCCENLRSRTRKYILYLYQSFIFCKEKWLCILGWWWDFYRSVAKQMNPSATIKVGIPFLCFLSPNAIQRTTSLPQL